MKETVGGSCVNRAAVMNKGLVSAVLICNRLVVWGHLNGRAMMGCRRIIECVLMAALVLVAGGCEEPMGEPHMQVSVPGSFSTSGTAQPGQRWWRTFGDERLNAVTERALANNFSLQSAWDRLAQARAVARKAGAALLPSADGKVRASRTRQETNSRTTYTSLYSVGLAASYEVDLWSRLESTKRAAWYDVQVSRSAVESAAITLAASVASTWYQLAEAKELVRIAERQIETNEKVLTIVKKQFGSGAAAAADVRRQEQLIASTRGTLIRARETAALLQYILSVLAGMPPELQWEDAKIELAALPAMPAAGVPADVLWRRPDIRQAYSRVQAADERLAAAIADQYPRISLSSTVETSAASVHDLFDDWLANVVGNLTQPLFDGGLRKAEVERQRAIVWESTHNWSQAILEALQDVETALTQERQQARLVENLELQLALAQKTYQLNLLRFSNGRTDYIRVLESLQSLQALERNVVTARRTLIGRRIDLYRSIAGAIELEAPERVDVIAEYESKYHTEYREKSDRVKE